jgi:phosphinothricin acetyltransferase
VPELVQGCAVSGAIKIRTAQPRDAAGIAAIYAHYVLHSVVTFEIAVPDDAAMAARMARVQGAGWPWLVAETGDGALAGYAYAAQYREREGWRFACEDSIYLAPEHTGQGIGAALLARLIPASEAAGFRHMIAVIAGGSDASIALHARAGFRHSGTLDAVGRKFGQWIDVVTMQRELGSGSAAPPGEEP